MDNGKIYVCFQVSVKEKTPEDLEKELKIHNLRYGRNDTMEQYKKFLHGWKEDRYAVCAEPTGYFDALEEAQQCIEANMADIWECGAYEYAAIVAMPKGCFYANAYTVKEDVLLYQFDTDTKTYKAFMDNSELFAAMNQVVRGVIEGWNG